MRGVVACCVVVVCGGAYPLTSPDPRFLGNELLGRPTDHSVTVNLIPAIDMDLYARFGPDPGQMTWRTPTISVAAGQPAELVLGTLAPNRRYWYCVYRAPAGGSFTAGPVGSFQTQRRRDKPYDFTVFADSHLQDMILDNDAERGGLYIQTIANVMAAWPPPDFHLMLGDDFHCEQRLQQNNAKDYAECLDRYLDQRPYLDRIGRYTPLFLVLGNHEGELGWRRDGSCDNVAYWSCAARKLIYPNPIPDPFYRTGPDVAECCGYREAYYAWEWGSAQYIVLDPLWHTLRRPHAQGGEPGSGDPWDWTLGEDQYRWLRDTLAASAARWKFVCLHHLTGGTTAYGRGGIEAVRFAVNENGSYEWGGENSDGTWGFADRRPGWEEPIHQLLVRHHVTAVLHGHDHFFAWQELDGIVYLECPPPGGARGSGEDPLYGYGFRDNGRYVYGDMLPNSGYMRVHVEPTGVDFSYVRTFLPGDGPNNEEAYHGRVPFVPDTDDDADVDISDYAWIIACFGGANRPYSQPPCAAVDADLDGDVDLSDAAAFSACFNGPGRPPACR